MWQEGGPRAQEQTLVLHSEMNASKETHILIKQDYWEEAPRQRAER